MENFHLDFKIVLREGEETCSFGNTVRVKQGDTLAPVLFILFMKTWNVLTNLPGFTVMGTIPETKQTTVFIILTKKTER